ncbi:SH3 domain-containing protein [Salmonella enterica]|nr:cell wall hydrolase [Salmonella enterica]EJI5637385.1 SH3 domain-containing protein [Salmonella enterica]
MQKIKISKGIKPLCLIVPLLLSASCHTVPVRPRLNSITPTDYIDQTKLLFPLENYPQSVDKWLPPGPERHIPVIDKTAQLRHFSALKSHYFGMRVGEKSPWNAFYIASVLSQGVEADRDASIKKYLGEKSVSWGANFRVHTNNWKQQIRDNATTNIDRVYDPSRRGITVRETLVRLLPTLDPAYDNPSQAGQGYPFDNLQESSIRPGTPIFVLSTSNDGRWKYVLSPTVTGWIYSEDIAMVDPQFVTEWLTLANRNLGAFIKESFSVNEKGQYYFTARPGTILPFRNKRPGLYIVTVPVRKSNGRAQIRQIELKEDEFVAMPWKMTPGNMAVLMKTMSGRPYGWGNYNFYNDCSAEIHSLMIAFGILLPRNSAAQIQAVSRIVDLSQANTNTRLRYLIEHGRPFTTLVYIQGHIMLYIGNTLINGQHVPMTYQNIWGLRPADSSSRSIIGGAVFFPLLASYPENPSLVSLAGKSQFKLGFIE